MHTRGTLAKKVGGLIGTANITKELSHEPKQSDCTHEGSPKQRSSLYGNSSCSFIQICNFVKLGFYTTRLNYDEYTKSQKREAFSYLKKKHICYW